MDYFNYKNDQLMAEEISVKQLVQQFGTPCIFIHVPHWNATGTLFDSALQGHPHLICFAVKSNPNIALLNLLAKLGSGFDIVSQGELERVLAAGGDANKVVFSGVAKSQ